MDPTLYEGTESLWPMGITAVILWVIVWRMLRKEGNE